MSPMTEFIFPSRPAMLNSAGSVGGFKEYPVTSAPAFTRILESQVPLKPVCPVTRIFFPL